MKNARFVHTLALGVTALAIGTAYADTVDGPGKPPVNVIFTFNVDSKIQSTTAGAYPIALSNGSGTAKITAKIDVDGDILGTTGSVVFDAFDSGGWAYQAYIGNFYGGHYCPNSGDATISVSAEVIVWKSNGFTLVQPCLISLGAVTLTTGTSGGFSGTRFTQPSPSMVAVPQVFTNPHGPLIGGLPPQYCDGEQTQTGRWLEIKNRFKTGGSGGVHLFNMNIDPHPYGNGC